MSTVQIQLHGAGWQNKDGISIKGSAFFGGSLLRAEDIQNALRNISSENDFSSFIENLNGFFAIIVEKNQQVFAAVDKIRSIPLFYSIRNGILYLSDAAEILDKRRRNHQTSDLIRLEFTLTGYVTGSDTLVPAVSQLQSGEYLIHRGPEEWHTRRYFTFLPELSVRRPKTVLWEEIDQVHIAAIERLAQWSEGRTIVIPLSGGYDSRLLAVLLKQIGYKNVLTYTYGRNTSAEVKMAQAVAESLGFECRCVEYTNEAWWRWYHSPERQDYFGASHNLTSIPHIQDWPAVWMLQKNNLIPPDAVMVPGHSGGFTAGRHMPKSFFELKIIGRDDFVSEVFNKHYALWGSSMIEPEMIGRIKARIESTSKFSDSEDSSFEYATRIYEAWEWQERQAKFIVNSLRVYDFWGYDWWLPLFDTEVVDFWLKVPYEWRVDGRLYADYAIKKYARIANLPMRVASRRVPKHEVRIERLTAATAPYIAARFLYYLMTTDRFRKSRRSGFSYDKNPLAIFGIMDRLTFDKYRNEIRNFHSFISKAVVEGEYF